MTDVVLKTTSFPTSFVFLVHAFIFTVLTQMNSYFEYDNKESRVFL